MDDVIFSRIFLLGNFDNFMNLKRTCKRAHKVSKLVWKQWLRQNTKRCDKWTKISIYDEVKEVYVYYNGKNGRRVLHGLYFYMYKKDIENYKHGKLHGERLLYKKDDSYIKMNYEKGALHGPMVRYTSSDRVLSVRFYNKGKKCCSISNDYDHFCPIHYKLGMKLMNWTRQKFLSRISQPVNF